jgi:hypothetical protein
MRRRELMDLRREAVHWLQKFAIRIIVGELDTVDRHIRILNCSPQLLGYSSPHAIGVEQRLHLVHRFRAFPDARQAFDLSSAAQFEQCP